VTRKEPVRLPIDDVEPGHDEARQTLDAGVCPLGSGQRPDLARRGDEIAGEREPPVVQVDEIAHRAHRVTRRRQGQHVERPVPCRPVLPDDAVDGDAVEERETVLAEVVVVVERPSGPVLVDGVDQPAFGGRRPDPDPGLAGTREPLRDVAMMVGQEDVGDAVDPEVGQVVEDGAGAEVDEDRLAIPAQDVDVCGVRVPENVRLELHCAAV
jgi:hypothetical protein